MYVSVFDKQIKSFGKIGNIGQDNKPFGQRKHFFESRKALQQSVEVYVHGGGIARRDFQFDVGSVRGSIDFDLVVDVTENDDNVAAFYLFGIIDFFVFSEGRKYKITAVAVHDFKIVMGMVPHIERAIEALFVIRFWEECAIRPQFSYIHGSIIIYTCPKINTVHFFACK